jgi:hypothetical protein
MKLDHYLHLLGPGELSEYLINTCSFPCSVCGIDLAVFCAALLRREIREMEIFRSIGWTRSIFWSGRALLVVGPGPGDAVHRLPDLFIVSAYQDSRASEEFRALGHNPTIHPFAYNPEWIEVFVFRV